MIEGALEDRRDHLMLRKTLRNAADLTPVGLISPERVEDIKRVAARYAVAITPAWPT